MMRLILPFFAATGLAVQAQAAAISPQLDPSTNESKIAQHWGQEMCARDPFAGQWNTTGCEPEPVANLCESNEKAVFSGVVDDDFGLGISVCLSGDDSAQGMHVTIRSAGEGGTTEVSCRIGNCEGVMSLQRYTRPRFTILTLEWFDNGSYSKIVESFDAQDEAVEPISIVTNFWASGEMLSSGAMPIESPVEAFTEPLSLLVLAGVLPAELDHAGR